MPRINSLSKIYRNLQIRRKSKTLGIVPPICYAQLAATQMAHFMKYDEMSAIDGAIPVTELPKLHQTVRSTMFFR